MAIKIGLAGAGHLGQIHLRCLKNLEEVELVGFFDSDCERARAVSGDSGVPAFESLEALMAQCDAIDVVTPTSTHAEVATSALMAGKHVFIEKPVTATVEEARRLLDLQQLSGLVVQVGHVERFNPAMLAIRHLTIDPRFIEVHRLAHFNPRGTDVSVVLDLMIHDLDILLQLVPADVSHISANGVCLVSDTPDIANARIEWTNGCVANVTASRMSFKAMRKMRIFQPDAYVGIDFLEKTAQIIRLNERPESTPGEQGHHFTLETAKGEKHIYIDVPEIKPVNAIQEELTCFVQSIRGRSRPEVTIEEGLRALELAFAISDTIEQNLRQFA